MSFKVRMEVVSKERQSPVVLALDFPFHTPEEITRLYAKAQKVLDAVHPYVCAVKINHHLVLPLGTFDGVQKLVKQIHERGLLAIMDCKVNDIGSTNEVMAKYYFAAGFDALIANPFVGWSEGLEPIFAIAHEMQRGVILLTYMSHKGAKDGYGQKIYEEETGRLTMQYLSFAEKALKWNADGAIVGATYPEKIREIHAILGEKVPIYSPGIGAQGGAAEEALQAGARYIIIGREITLSNNPEEVAKRLHEKVRSGENKQTS
ncbi:MAG: orotidine 5'-phosphate decarboxylase [Candidatus Bathyarchaeota archaeon]|nr:orotidine 5'-phosphate decarboxylase [Candidatus Bathyarchaeota archaeon]